MSPSRARHTGPAVTRRPPLHLQSASILWKRLQKASKIKGMKRAKKKTLVRRSDCAVACTLDFIGDRWTALIMRDLLRGRRHFDDFLRSPEGIATNILSARLRRCASRAWSKKRQTRPTSGGLPTGSPPTACASGIARRDRRLAPQIPSRYRDHGQHQAGEE